MFGNIELDEEMGMPYEIVGYTELSESQSPVREEYDMDNVLGFTAEILDQEKFIKKNPTCVKEVTNPVFFVRSGVPTPDGLLSNEIFGITKDERSGIYGYIDLGGTYIDPSCYKAWCKIDPKVKNVVHGIGEWIVNDKGEFQEVDSGGHCGVDFIKRNMSKIKFKRTESQKRDLKINYLIHNKEKMFITKCICIPAYYRDVNTEQSSLGVGEINKMYAQLITLAKSPKESDYYGLSKTNAIAGRMQETLVAIFDYLSANTNTMIKDPGTGLSGKEGVIRKSVMSRTADYSSRLVITAPDVKKESRKDIMVDLDHVAMPLAVACTDFYPYVVFNIKRFFENEFSEYQKYPVINGKGQAEYVEVSDPLIEFSEERINRELKRYLHGYSNRFIPIEVPLKEKKKEKYYMMFKGKSSIEDAANNEESIYHRRLTWCDIFYMAAVEACKDKMCLVTRYPMDSRHNQFPCGIIVSSTKDVEPMYIGNEYYKYYPKIREEDIGSNTSSAFVDTLMMSNLYLNAIGGDYDGDTTTVKGVYTTEANDELRKYAQSKANYIDLGSNIIRTPSKEAIISMYAVTMVVDSGAKLTDPVF